MSGSTGRMKLFHLNASAWAHQFHASTRNPGRPDAPFLVGFDLTGTAALGAVAQVPVFRQIHLNGASMSTVQTARRPDAAFCGFVGHSCDPYAGIAAWPHRQG